jgi:PEP-CTERM motif
MSDNAAQQGEEQGAEMATFGARVGGALAATMALAMALSAPPAQAVTFLWNYSGGGLSGGGTLEATDEGGGAYLITSISGLANGVTISGLTEYNFPDQIIFYPDPPNVVVDPLGFSFGIGDGSNSYNIYGNNGFYAGKYLDCGALYCIVAGATDNSGLGPDPTDAVTALASLTLTQVAVPEPSTWAMMLLGFAGLGFAGYRQRQKLSGAAGV